MAICTFYQKGNCKFGSSCRNEHIDVQGPSGGFGSSNNRFGAFNRGGGDSYRPGQAGYGNRNQAPRFHLSREAIKIELIDERPIYPLSCYAAGRDTPRQLIEGPFEVSPEELRVRYYIQRASGNENAAQQEERTLHAQMQQQVDRIMNDLDGAIKYVEDGEHIHPNRLDVAQGKAPVTALGTQSSSTQPSNPFGGGAQTQAPGLGQASTPVLAQPRLTAFGQPSNSGQSTSAFGQPSNPGQTTSAFGQPSNPGQPTSPFAQPLALGGGSAFGKPSLSAAGAFGQPSSSGSGSAFGQSSALGGGSAFGKPSLPGAGSAFGQAGALGQQSAFGQPSAPGATSGFGKPSMPGQTSAFGQSNALGQGSAFGKPAFGASGFGQPSQPGAGASPFGQAASKPSPFGQQKPQSNQPSPFGQQKPQGNQPSPFGQQQPPTNQQSPFGQQKPPQNQPSPFGQQQPQTSQPSPFGQQQQTSPPSNPFGNSNSSQNPAFGQTGFAKPSPSPFGTQQPRQPAAADANGFGQRVQSPTAAPLQIAGSAKPIDPKDRCKEGKPEDYEGEQGKLLEEIYKRVAQLGKFEDDEDIPLVPPKCEWIVPVPLS